MGALAAGSGGRCRTARAQARVGVPRAHLADRGARAHAVAGEAKRRPAVGTDGSVAVTAQPKLDARRLRADFPIFEQSIHGKPLAYLDSANSSQKPRQVLETPATFYETSYGTSTAPSTSWACARRAYDGARREARAFVNAESTAEVIFTRNATEGSTWSPTPGARQPRPRRPRPRHGARAPLELRPLAVHRRADGRRLRGDPDRRHGGASARDARRAGDARPREARGRGLVSNSLGTVNPVEQLAAWAHERGAIMVVDAAQAAPHRPLDVQALGATSSRFTGHKMCGPTGIGVLWGRRSCSSACPPSSLAGR